jgi:hypothetical protein
MVRAGHLATIEFVQEWEKFLSFSSALFEVSFARNEAIYLILVDRNEIIHIPDDILSGNTERDPR